MDEFLKYFPIIKNITLDPVTLTFIDGSIFKTDAVITLPDNDLFIYHELALRKLIECKLTKLDTVNLYRILKLKKLNK